MTSIRKLALSASLIIGTSVIGASAAAQTTNVDDGTQDSAEIVVTAQKSGAQSILEVPGSISALSAETLSNAGVRDLRDVARLTPGLQLTETFGRSGNYLTIRGVSSSITGAPTVQVFEDGFTTGLASNINNGLVDLERVEILRGPQATLYGANAIGGVVNYITQRPGPYLEGGARVSYGELNDFSASANLSGPIANNFYAGISGLYHQRDGYLDNIATGESDVNDQQDYSVRGAVRLTPGSATTIDFTVSYSDTDDGCGDCSYVPADFSLPATPGDTSLRDGLIDLTSYDTTIDSAFPNRLQRSTDTEVLTLEHDFGDVILTSITGRGAVETDLEFDLGRAATRVPGLSIPVLSAKEDESVSQELRLTNADRGGLRWVLGGYASQVDSDQSVFVGGALANQTTNTTTNYAAFVDVRVPVTEQLTIGGGLRYDYRESSGENVLFAVSREVESEEVLPRLTVEYRFPDADVMTYATVSKGYTSGGVNIGSPDPTVPGFYNPEYLWNYEVGLKGRAFSNRLLYTLSAFRMNWTDRQVQLLDPSGLYVYLANLGEAHIDGAELALNWEVGEGLSIAVSTTLLNAEVDQYLDGSGLSQFYAIDPNLEGNRLPSAPELSLTISPEYETSLSNGWLLRARADVNYTSDFYFDAQNLLPQEDYFVVNTSLDFERDRLEIGVFARNLFDERYHTSGNLSTLGPFMTTSEPRIIGIRAGYSY